MERDVAGVAGVLGMLDAIITHVGLKDGEAEDANPLWRSIVVTRPGKRSPISTRRSSTGSRRTMPRGRCARTPRRETSVAMLHSRGQAARRLHGAFFPDQEYEDLTRS